MGKKRRRTFTPEQKAEAVKIVRQSGRSINQVATAMGLTTSFLRNWVNQAESDQRGTPDGLLNSEERKELVQLRKELKRVQQEREFLKNHPGAGGLTLDPGRHAGAYGDDSMWIRLAPRLGSPVELDERCGIVDALPAAGSTVDATAKSRESLERSCCWRSKAIGRGRWGATIEYSYV